jgi:hypothetical protein
MVRNAGVVGTGLPDPLTASSSTAVPATTPSPAPPIATTCVAALTTIGATASTASASWCTATTHSSSPGALTTRRSSTPRTRSAHVERVRVSSGVIERLRLAPAVLQARAGKIAHVRMSPTHPKAWKARRSVQWRLLQDTRRSAASPSAQPAARSWRAAAIKLARSSPLAPQGKTVTARLALRLPKALAGTNLSVDVAATDAQRRRQIQPAASLIRVARSLSLAESRVGVAHSSGYRRPPSARSTLRASPPRPRWSPVLSGKPLTSVAISSRSTRGPASQQPVTGGERVPARSRILWHLATLARAVLLVPGCESLKRGRQTTGMDDEHVPGARLLPSDKPAVCRRSLETPLAIELDDR